MNKAIHAMFSELSKTYDLANRVLSFGLDMPWRRRAAKATITSGKRLWIDICSGTGDMAFVLKSHAVAETMIIAVDGCMPMIREAAAKKKLKGIRFIVADAASLPFRNGLFDLATISFATRNLNTIPGNLNKCFGEFRRIVKPGGSFVNTETSQPPNLILRKLFHLYVKFLVKPVGMFLSGSRAGYTYLSRTIPRFMSAEELNRELRTSGFSDVRHQYCLGGIVAIHTAK